MLDLLFVEVLKLRRSLALLLCCAAPLLVALMAFFLLINGRTAPDWERFLLGAAALWSFAMLPLTVTALTLLLAQQEHGGKMWRQLLALPLPRWRLFAAKLIVAAGLLGAMHGGLWLLAPLAGWAGGLVRPDLAPTGAPDLAPLAQTLAAMCASALLLLVLQSWAALRFRSFVPPLVLGIGGTFAAVAATAARQGVFFPWLMPVQALASDPARAELALALGAGGGLLAAAALLLHLPRHTFE